MGIAEFSMQNRLIMAIVILGSLFGGYYAYENMGRFEDPEFTIRTAVVVTQYPGASPEEVAREVTDPLETAIQQLQEVEGIRSESKAGVSTINVDFKYEFSPTKTALQGLFTKLRNKVSDAARQLPPGSKTPFVNDDFGDVFGIYYLITGDGYSMRELEDYAKQLRADLLMVEGVGKVSLSGAQREAIYVEISRERASALGVSVKKVYSDLAQQNAVVSAGDVEIGNRRLVIQPSGLVDSVAAIENLEVSTESGTIVYLRDIASISREYVTPSSLELRWNGQPAIALGVANVIGANVVKMGDGINARLAETLESRPIGIELNEFYHQGDIVDRSVADFAANVMIALAIVLVTLLIFMGMRSALVIGGVLLLTIAATLLLMFLSDIPMHRISLGALIIALGMLVDNAIVVTEGILVGVQRGQSKLDAAKDIVSKTMWPLLGGTLVGIIAFAPIGFSPGATAEYTGHLFWVILISLSLSWIFALTAVPLLADLLFRETNPSADSGSDSFFAARYKLLMRSLIGVRYLALAAAMALFVLAIWGFQFVKGGFFPASTTPQVVVDYWLPEGTDVSQTKADMLEIEPYLAGLEGVAGVHTLIGGGGMRYMLVYDPGKPNSAYGQFLIQAESYETVGELLPLIQAYLNERYPDAQAKVWRFQLGPGGGSKLEAQFSGPDPAVLRVLANQAKAIISEDPSAIVVKDDWRQPVSVVVPSYSESRGRRVGISREDLANALLTNFSGRAVGIYREGDRLIPIIARAPENERLDGSEMAGVQIPSQTTGGMVPLVEVVDGIDTMWRDSVLRRMDRQWTIKAQADPVAGVSASELLERIRPQIEALELPPGYSFEWAGEYGDSTEANENLASTLPLGFLAMVLVVVFLFNAMRQPLLIFLVVPLAVIGVVPGLLVTGTALEFMAILGLLSLSGLLIKNSIVLVDQMDLEIREGKARLDAIIDSAASRVRPVMMGSLTTVLGVIPLYGDAFFQSMAVVLIFGLVFATILTLLLVPVLYAILFRVKLDETANQLF